MKRTLHEEPRLCDRSFFSQWCPAMVRHSDLDPNGHVTNSVYAAWLDDGRYTLLRDSVAPLVAPTDAFALAAVTIDYVREVGFRDAPRIGTAVLRLGRSSIEMGQAVFVGEDCVAAAHSVTVVMDRGTRRARTLTEPERQALSSLLGDR